MYFVTLLLFIILIIDEKSILLSTEIQTMRVIRSVSLLRLWSRASFVSSEQHIWLKIFIDEGYTQIWCKMCCIIFAKPQDQTDENTLKTNPTFALIRVSPLRRLRNISSSLWQKRISGFTQFNLSLQVNGERNYE